MALDLSALRRIIADENCLLTGADIPAEYQSDVLGRVHGSAEALAFPLSTEEVSALLRYAHEHRVPVTPRGAGTNLVGSTVPLEGGIILDLSRMDRVLELDEDTMTVTVEPGMLLQDLQAYVEARELHENMDRAYAEAYRLGGVASGEHGIGLSKRPYFLRQTAKENLQAMNAIKTALDPQHILNNGKSYLTGGNNNAGTF
ncbi:FAD-binding oxidoreductase [Hominicoprocola fusiformis]